MAIGLTSAPATSLVAHVVEAEAVRHRARAGDDALSLAAQIVPGFMEEHSLAFTRASTLRPPSSWAESS